MRERCFAATAKQKELARSARALHAHWLESVDAGRLSAESAHFVVEDVHARSESLRRELEQHAITTEEHNDERFVMVMALRRFIDGGAEERAARMISREMHDLFADSPPLPHARYRITFDYVTPHVGSWERDLAHLKDRPAVRALEVGCFEGQSACWFLDNILTHPTSHLTCVDQFSTPMDTILLRFYERNFDHNIAVSGAAHRLTKLVGLSQVVLRTLPPAHFDFAYVDGSHKVGDVLQDAVLAWGLLKRGGIAIFDDYDLVDDVAPGLQARVPARALDAFVSILGDGATVLRRDWQLVLRKQ